MRLVRTILALAIVVSLALLPVGASLAAGFVMVSGNPQSSMQMGASNDISMDDCCPDDMKGAPSHTDGYNCGMGFCCVGGAVALGDIRTVRFEFLPAVATKVAIPSDQIIPVRGSSPPFRPPRV
jgi:hypothetical protein